MDNDLLKIVESIGLKPKEASVYLALLELQKGTVSQIAKLSSLKRPIIYVAIERLIKDGYVTQLPEKKINQYQVMDPVAILSQKKSILKNFAQMLPLLQTLHNKGHGRPRIQYIESKKGIWNVYEEMNFVQEAFFVSDYATLESHFPGAIKDWVKNCRSGFYKVVGRHLIPDSPQNIEFGKMTKDANQKVRILPGIKKYNMDFTIYENKLAITSLGQEPFMVLIESQELVDSIKPIFEIAWRAGRAI